MEDSIFFLYDYSALFGKSSPRGYYLQMSSEELYVPRMPARGMRKLIGFSISVFFVFFLFFSFFLFLRFFFLYKKRFFLFFFVQKTLSATRVLFLKDPENSLNGTKSTRLTTCNASTGCLLRKNCALLCTLRFHFVFLRFFRVFLCCSAFSRRTKILRFEAKFDLKQLEKGGNSGRNIV